MSLRLTPSTFVPSTARQAGAAAAAQQERLRPGRQQACRSGPEVRRTLLSGPSGDVGRVGQAAGTDQLR